MSGHSKWANIKHKKGKTDALKAKLATKSVVKLPLQHVWVVQTQQVICA